MMYTIGSQIKFKALLFRSSFVIIVTRTYLLKELQQFKTQGQHEPLIIETDNVIFKNCVPFPDFISEINSKEIDHAKDIDVVMPMYNLIEASDNYSKTSGSLWHQNQTTNKYQNQF